MSVNNRSRTGIVFSLTLLIISCFATHAFSDSLNPLQAIGKFFTREYLFLGYNHGCYDGSKNVHFSLDAIQGNTELEIPINYIMNSDNWSGVINLWIELGLDPESLEPYCDKALPRIKAGEHSYAPSFPKPMSIYISNWSRGGMTMEEEIEVKITGTGNSINAYTGESGGYSVYKGPPNRSSFDEMLIPNSNSLGTLYYLECNAAEPKGICKMTFHYKDRLNIKIDIPREKMTDLTKIYHSTTTLLDKFSANQ